MYVLHRKTTKITNPRNTTARFTKSIHPRVEGRKGRWEGKWHRERKYSNQSRHKVWQMLENSYRKTCGPFRLTVLKIHVLVSGRFCLSAPETRFQFPREKGLCRGPLAEWVLPPPGREGNREKSCHILPPIPPVPCGWQVKSVACSSLQFGRRRVW